MTREKELRDRKMVFLKKLVDLDYPPAKICQEMRVAFPSMTLGAIKTMLYKQRRKLGMPLTNAPRINEQQKADIHRLLDIGMKYSLIATAVGVVESQVAYVARKKNALAKKTGQTTMTEPREVARPNQGSHGQTN
jgi:hypothetical protein